MTPSACSAVIGLVAGHCRSRFDPDARAFPESGVLVDALADMQNELRSRTGDAFTMRHLIERTLQFRMLVDVLANLSHRFACRLQTLLKLSLGFHLGLA